MIKIATDTIADLPADVISQHHIHIVPAWIYLKTGKYRTDTLTHQELYTLVADLPDTPRTEPLTEAEYGDLFRQWAGEDDTLIMISASGRISKVYEIAQHAAQRVSPQIRVHDSGGISLWQGFEAIRAAQMAASGYDLESILGTLGRMSRQSQFFFVVDNLGYLHRGGRVNMAQYMLGTVFDLKPILSIKDGVIVPVARTRGHERMLIELQLRLLESMKGILNVWLGVIHTRAPEMAQRLATQMQNTLRPSYSLITEAGLTISAHAGPGAVGVAVCPCERGQTKELKLREGPG
jgi:DegV family protein with EDD domain